jgi:hypothetical protein
MKLIIRSLIAAALLLFTVKSSYAIKLSGRAPHTSNSDLNNILDDVFENRLLNEANDELTKFDDQPKLAKGFANANVYAAQAATQQGFQDYSIFAVTTGFMLGVQLPSRDPDYYDDLGDKIEEEGDLYGGVGTGLAIINLGINAGFIYPGLYLSAKFGTMSYEEDELTTKSTLFGIGVNYSWIRTKSIAAGLIKWRGVSFGTGFIYNKNKSTIEIELDTLDESFDESGYTGTLYLDPSVELGVESKTYTIPFDVTTSARVLWLFNFNLGLGVDLSFGSSDIILESSGKVWGEFAGFETTEDGWFKIDAGTRDKKPSLVHARITTGVGLNIFPVKVDVPVILYPFEDAFAIGLTAGIVW